MGGTMIVCAFDGELLDNVEHYMFKFPIPNDGPQLDASNGLLIHLCNESHVALIESLPINAPIDWNMGYGLPTCDECAMVTPLILLETINGVNLCCECMDGINL